MLEINLYLFGKPQWELSTKNITAHTLHKKALALSQRLQRAAHITKKLQANGWSVFLDTYSLIFYHESITTQKEAKKLFKKLGISLRKTEIYSWEENAL